MSLVKFGWVLLGFVFVDVSWVRKCEKLIPHGVMVGVRNFDEDFLDLTGGCLGVIVCIVHHHHHHDHFHHHHILLQLVIYN